MNSWLVNDYVILCVGLWVSVCRQSIMAIINTEAVLYKQVSSAALNLAANFAFSCASFITLSRVVCVVAFFGHQNRLFELSIFVVG